MYGSPPPRIRALEQKRHLRPLPMLQLEFSKRARSSPGHEIPRLPIGLVVAHSSCAASLSRPGKVSEHSVEQRLVRRWVSLHVS